MASSHQFRAPEAANYVRLSASTLAKMRGRGDGPRYCKVGPRTSFIEKMTLMFG